MTIRNIMTCICDRCGKRSDLEYEGSPLDLSVLDKIIVDDCFPGWTEVLKKDLCPDCKRLYLEMRKGHEAEFNSFLEEAAKP